MSELIVWEQNTPRKRCYSDVRVTTKDGHTAFTFYNGAHHKVTKRCWMKVGFTDRRAYFADGDSFKVRSQKNPMTVKVVTRGERTKFCGDHKLEYDAEQKLWYIQAAGGANG